MQTFRKTVKHYPVKMGVCVCVYIYIYIYIYIYSDEAVFLLSLFARKSLAHMYQKTCMLSTAALLTLIMVYKIKANHPNVYQSRTANYNMIK